MQPELNRTWTKHFRCYLFCVGIYERMKEKIGIPLETLLSRPAPAKSSGTVENAQIVFIASLESKKFNFSQKNFHEEIKITHGRATD